MSALKRDVGDDQSGADGLEPTATSQPATRKRMRKYASEAVIGLLIGLLVLWVLIVSVSDVEFVYQGF